MAVFCVEKKFQRREGDSKRVGCKEERNVSLKMKLKHILVSMLCKNHLSNVDNKEIGEINRLTDTTLIIK